MAADDDLNGNGFRQESLPLSLPYSDRRMMGEAAEKVAVEIIRRYSIDLYLEVVLEIGEYRLRTDAIFTTKENGKDVRWALEVYHDLTKQRYHRIFEFWGRMQPFMQEGKVDRLLVVSPGGISVAGVREISRFKNLFYAPVENLEIFCANNLVEYYANTGEMDSGGIPPQGAGPHFALDSNAKVALVKKSNVDAFGNNNSRIDQLLPIVRELADDLERHLNPNEVPALLRNIKQYNDAISGDARDIPWGFVYGLGVVIENNFVASQRHVEERLIPALEDSVQAALMSLSQLHNLLLAATAEGRELQEKAEHLHLTREEQAEFRIDAQDFADQLARRPDIAERFATEVVSEAGRAVGKGRHPERGAVHGITTVKHIATVIVGAATLASLIPVGSAVAGPVGAAAGAGVAWAAYEGVKKTRFFSSAIAALGSFFDTAYNLDEEEFRKKMSQLSRFLDFVTRNEELFRRIGAHSDELKWISYCLDKIGLGKGGEPLNKKKEIDDE